MNINEARVATVLYFRKYASYEHCDCASITPAWTTVDTRNFRTRLTHRSDTEAVNSWPFF